MRPTRGRHKERFDRTKARKLSWWKCKSCGNKDKDKDGNPPWVRHNGKRYCRKCGAKRLIQ
jgi:hypothetical protein